MYSAAALVQLDAVLLQVEGLLVFFDCFLFLSADFFCLQLFKNFLIHVVTHTIIQKLFLSKTLSSLSLVSVTVAKISFVSLAPASVSLFGSVSMSPGQRSGSVNHSGPLNHGSLGLSPWQPLLLISVGFWLVPTCLYWMYALFYILFTLLATNCL